MPTSVNTALADQESELSFMRQLTSLQSKLVTSTSGRLSLESQINASYNEQYLKAQEFSGLEKKIMESSAKNVKIQQMLLVLRQAQTSNIGNYATIQDDINRLVDDQRRTEIDILQTERAITLEKDKQRKFSDTLNKLNLESIDKLLVKWKDFNAQSGAMKGMMVFAFLLKNALNVFMAMDSAAADFRKSIGATRIGTQAIEENARAIAFELAHVGVSAKEAYAAFDATAKSIGTTRAVTKEMASSMSLMTAQLGIASETSADFLKTMGMVSTSTMASQTSMLGFTQGMTEAAGIPLNLVMQDVASASKTSYQFLTRNALALAKSAVEARKLGTSLESATKSAGDLINFSSSIKNEMEASVLLGKSLNLQKARELAYNKDIGGLNKEIVKLAKEANFNQLDPFQQEAVAKALGKTAGEIGQILQAEKEWQDIEAKAAGDPRLKSQLDRYKALEKATKERAKAEAESVDHQLRIRSNQAAIVAITQSWKAIVQRLAETFLPAIAWVLETIGKLMGALNNHWTAWIGLIGAAGAAAIATFGVVNSLIGKLLGTLGKGAGMAVSGFLSGLATGLSALGAAAPVALPAVGILLALAAAITIVAFGVSLIMKALPQAAEGFSIFAKAIKTLEFKDILKMAALSGVMALMIPTLLPFSVGAAAAGAGFYLLGQGLASVVGALKDLQSISLFNLIKQMSTLAIELGKLGKSIDDIPQVNIEKVKSLGSIDVKTKEKSQAEVSAGGYDINEKILAELQAIRRDFANGGIRANVRIGAQELVSTVAREYDRLGPIGPGVRARG